LALILRKTFKRVLYGSGPSRTRPHSGHHTGHQTHSEVIEAEYRVLKDD